MKTTDKEVTMAKQFTKYQIEEIIALINVRQDTISDDQESASGLELIPDALDILMKKVESGDMNFTPKEKQWLLEECECRADVALANQGNEGVKILGMLNSMNNAITKIMDL
jgi:hypothetical protein